jgi:hypothetical protein
MEVYKRETKAMVNRFLRHQLNFASCISGLDAALVRFIPRMHPGDLEELRAVMLANNERVMKEMENRPLGDLGQANAPPRKQ